MWALRLWWLTPMLAPTLPPPGKALAVAQQARPLALRLEQKGKELVALALTTLEKVQVEPWQGQAGASLVLGVPVRLGL